jgi:heme/copper-type cytochrome/quinol oxidase subunit 1
LGNYVIPAAIKNGMAFPQLNFVGLFLFYISVVLMLGSLFALDHQTFIMAMALNIASALFCSVNFIGTIIQLRKSGVRWMQMRFVVWSLFATAALVLLTFLPLEAAAVMQFGHSFRDSLYWAAPSHSATDASIPSLWKHAFWFLGHPEVYILFLFVLGIFLEGFKILVQRVIRAV